MNTEQGNDRYDYDVKIPACAGNDHGEVLQINGKLRGTVEVSKTIGQEAAVAAGTALDTVARQMEGKSVRKVIFVPGKILNIIVG